MLQTYSGGCEYVSIAWVLASKVPPTTLFKQFKVYGT